MLPHAPGSVPDRQLMSERPVPRANVFNAGKEPLSAQEAGSVPVRGMSKRLKPVREGKAAASPQLDGSEPACMTCGLSALHGTDADHRLLWLGLCNAQLRGPSLPLYPVLKAQNCHTSSG